MKDLVGNEITCGCVVALAVRYGNSGKLVLRVVRSIEGSKLKLYNPKTGRCGYSGATDNMLKLEYFSEGDIK